MQYLKHYSSIKIIMHHIINITIIVIINFISIFHYYMNSAFWWIILTTEVFCVIIADVSGCSAKAPIIIHDSLYFDEGCSEI